MGLFEVGGVRRIALGLDTQGGDFGFGSLAVLVDYQVRKRDVRTLLGELQSDGLANTAGCTRDDGDLAFE